MKILALVLLAPATVLLAAEPPPANRLELWYDRPAVYWEEALPVGNGRIGAMVHGGVLREHIQLNEETIWSGAPTPAMSVPSFREVRRRTELLFAGRVRATEELKLSPAEIAALRLPAPKLVPGTSSTRHVHQPLGDLYLHFDLGTAREENYRRSLDLDTAIASTTYRLGDVEFTREVFASFPANVLVVHLAVDRPGALNFAASLDYRRDVAGDTYRYDAELGAKVDSVTTPPRPIWTDLGGNRFAWRGRGHPDGTRFDARFEVRPDGGRVTATPEGFRVAGAQRVTILLAVGPAEGGRA